MPYYPLSRSKTKKHISEYNLHLLMSLSELKTTILIPKRWTFPLNPGGKVRETTTWWRLTPDRQVIDPPDASRLWSDINGGLLLHIDWMWMWTVGRVSLCVTAAVWWQAAGFQLICSQAAGWPRGGRRTEGGGSVRVTRPISSRQLSGPMSIRAEGEQQRMMGQRTDLTETETVEQKTL